MFPASWGELNSSPLLISFFRRRELFIEVKSRGPSSSHERKNFCHLTQWNTMIYCIAPNILITYDKLFLFTRDDYWANTVEETKFNYQMFHFPWKARKKGWAESRQPKLFVVGICKLHQGGRRSKWIVAAPSWLIQTSLILLQRGNQPKTKYAIPNAKNV